MLKRTLRRITEDRTVRSLLMAAVIVVVAGSLRVRENYGMPVRRYWAEKVAWQGVGDMVMAGDSRVRCGLAPQALREVLGSYTILNYGFGANGFSEEYLQATRGVLREEGPCRAILLGITPLVFSPAALTRNTFTEETTRPAVEHFYGRTIPGVLAFFEPLSPDDMVAGLFPETIENTRRVDFYPDGWAPGQRGKIKPTRYLGHYRNVFARDPVSWEVVANLCGHVRRWREEGIRVYAFRMPAHETMKRLEDEQSGYDESRFIELFAQAGGQWLELAQEDFATFDGVHMMPEAAWRFSTRLAEALCEHDPDCCQKTAGEK